MSQRTYWHLEAARRIPSEYEISTSRLLYYPGRGFEVQSPVARWSTEQQAATALKLDDWDLFADPRQTTYSKYVEQAQAREIYVDGLLGVIDTMGYDLRLSEDWGTVLDRVMAPLRFPVHGLQMAAAYVASMVPSGRIAVALLFQAADEMRLVQRLAYRTRQLQGTWSEFGRNSQQVWEDDPIWQPLRKAIERLLVCYDWTEALVTLNLVIKPVMRELYLAHFGRLAAAHGDEILEKLLRALLEDQTWQRSWSNALLTLIVENPQNKQRVMAILTQHTSNVDAIATAMKPIFDVPLAHRVGMSMDQVLISIRTELEKQRSEIGLAI